MTDAQCILLAAAQLMTANASERVKYRVPELKHERAVVIASTMLKNAKECCR
ncbi:MAG: hypothetical protein ACW987_19340 [Candidatus Thorarchaeota archaeon]|jgi:hypothetical protein